MTWLAFRVEVHTTDGKDDTPERIRREMLRALEHRFSAVTVEEIKGIEVFAMGHADPVAVVEPAKAGPWKVGE